MTAFESRYALTLFFSRKRLYIQDWGDNNEYFFMEVLKSRNLAFSLRVLEEYERSRGYLKINERQRVCSVEVLKFLLSHGVDNVRRREIREKFTVGREEWKRPAVNINGRWKKPALPMTDSELQRVLERLILSGFVNKEMSCPDSKRTKDRQKKDAYYNVSILLLNDEDWLGGEELIAYRESMSPEAVEGTTMMKGYLMARMGRARSELRRLRITNTSNEDLDMWLRMATGLPLK